MLAVVCAAGADPAGKTPGPNVRVETIDARTYAGLLVSMSPEKITLKTDRGAKSFQTTDVAEIAVTGAASPLTTNGRIVIEMRDGRFITAGKLAIDAGKVNITNTSLGDLGLAFAGVRVVYMPAAGQSAGDVVRKCRAQNIGESTQDVVVVARKSGGWLGVQGVLKSVDGKALTFSWKGTDRKIGRPTVRAIFLAPTGAKPVGRSAGVLKLKDGSAVRFASLTYAQSVFNADVVGSGGIKIAAGSVAAVRYTSDRITNLSDLEPRSVRQYGLLDTVMSWKANKSASGRALMLGGRTYATGI